MKRIRTGRTVLFVVLAAAVMTACSRNRDAGTERSSAAQTEGTSSAGTVEGTSDAGSTTGGTTGTEDAVRSGTDAEGTGSAAGGTGNSVEETGEGVIRGLVDDAENAMRDMTGEPSGQSGTAGE